MFGIVSLVLVAVAGADPADPKPAPAAPRQLLLVPESSSAALTLARVDARVVARYESFAIVEAAGEHAERLRAAGAQRRDDMREVATAAGEVDPAADRASLAGKEVPELDRVLALVQFVGPPKEAWVRRLRATGARMVSYQPENAYAVHATGAAVERLAALVGADPAVRAVTRVTVADKVEGKADATGRYAVSSVAGAVGTRLRERAAAAGAVVEPATSVGALRTQHLRLSPAEVDELARDPAVVAIEREGTPRPHDERTAQIVSGNLLAPALSQPSGPGYLAWHDALVSGPLDFAIDITDSGLDDGSETPDHPDFYELGVPANGTRINDQRDFTPDASAEDCAGHGTNVATIAAGYNSGAGAPNEDAADFNYGLGVAPRARIVGSKIFPCDGSDSSFSPTALTSSAYDENARISNNSWGTSGGSAWSDYDSDSALYDQLVRDAQPGTANNQQMVEVFSAGNDGETGAATINMESTAKNVITVGASEGVRATGGDGCMVPDTSADNARQIVGFSSRGPTDDGRLKPDLVAPGTHVTGVRPQHGDFIGDGTCTPFFAGTYSLVSGTSQAAPQVSGAAALVRRWYEDAEGTPPSPALTKALLINTATDLAAGPDGEQGWGRVNLGTAFDLTPRELYDQRVGDPLTNVGATDARAFTVSDPTQPVKVTLVWTDAPGSITGDSWVNNLDLEVSAGGGRYLGNVFAGAISRSGGAADPRNNVESVHLPAGTAGRLSVRVRATNLPGDGVPGVGDGSDQDFALVVSNAVETGLAPVFAHESLAIHDGGAGGDGDGVLESGEQAQLTEQARNAGSAASAGATAGLAGGPGLSVTQGGSAYPALAPDGVGSSSPPFAVQLAGSAACGADVTATLAMTSGGETQSIPLVLPTGEEGALQSYGAASTPIFIPDNNASGVSSSVFVSDGSLIKDLEVAIPAIAHTWVGDLVIDLTGPDGTRVRLADHPGGPDNFADNLAGTVFDDEAPASISSGAAPYSGSFRPQNDQLARFDGKSRHGTWTLTVRDTFDGDLGTLNGWSLQTHAAVCDFSPAGPPPPPPPPSATSFALAPVEERLADALAGRYRVLAACASACRASAKLSVSARTARRLKLGRRAVSLASARRSRRSAGAVATSLRFTKRARAALRGRDLTKATLQVTLTEGSSRLKLRRTVALRRTSGPRRIAKRGLRLWTVSASRSSVRGKLTISAREARRLGLRPGHARRMELASGRTTATRTPRVLTLRVRRSARRAFARARRVAALLEAVAGTSPQPTRTAQLSKTLRR